MANEAAGQQASEPAHREPQPAGAVADNLRQQLEFQTQLAAVARISAHIAHELRNPLGVVRNAVFFLKRKVPPDQPKWHEYLEMIERETAAAERILADMLASTRVEAPAKKAAALGELVTAARLRVAATEGLAWRVICPEEPWLLDVDAAQLEQVFTNLFSNAIAAMGQGGTITVEAVRRPQHDEISITDSGPGVAEEIRARIFQPLFSTRRKGTGLGLSQCRQIIEGHGGTIELVESPQGARFRIRLPR
jgi:signal transduction histidine kinase